MELADALPQGFDFYHLGRVELAEAPAAELEGCYGIAFRILGDRRGLVLLAVEEGLDLSTYSEVGNVIASRLADELSRNEGVDCLISAPQFLSPAQLKRLAASGAPFERRTYFHRHDEISLRLEALVFASALAGYAPSEGAVHV